MAARTPKPALEHDKGGPLHWLELYYAFCDYRVMMYAKDNDDDDDYACDDGKHISTDDYADQVVCAGKYS